MSVKFDIVIEIFHTAQSFENNFSVIIWSALFEFVDIAMMCDTRTQGVRAEFL
jgi:hypothetical protein